MKTGLFDISKYSMKKMPIKVLFVSSGNYREGVSPIIKNQGESLKKAGIHVEYFLVEGKGITGYLRAASGLRNRLLKNRVDIIHAHYTLSGWSAVLSFTKKPIVLSLMGDDANGTYIAPDKKKNKSIILKILTYTIQPFVDAIISKSENIHRAVHRKNKAYIIPNGVEINKFNIMCDGLRGEMRLDSKKKYVLFLGDKNNRSKNYKLVEDAVTLMRKNNVDILAPFPVEHEKVIKYLHCADVLVLPSFMEGSPNVVKEAMASNCPVVATDVGDVRWVIGETEGCFIASFDPEDFAHNIEHALHYADKKGRTRGRERLVELGLDSETTARRIIAVYQRVLN